jgi:hypothetical protein
VEQIPATPHHPRDGVLVVNLQALNCEYL